MNNSTIFGDLNFVPSSEYEPRERSHAHERLFRWKKIDTATINSLYERVLQKETASWRHVLRAIEGRDHMKEWVGQSFVERAKKVFRIKEAPKRLLYSREIEGFQASAGHFMGLRPCQEDMHVWGSFPFLGRTIPFFALCDGHAGDGAALFMKEHLRDLLEEVLTRSFSDESVFQGEMKEVLLENALMMVGVLAEERLAKLRNSKEALGLHEKIHEVGEQYEKLLRSEERGEKEEMMGQEIEVFRRSCQEMLDASNVMPFLFGGTTLTAVLLIDSTLWMVQVGDSRAMLVEQQRWYQLTEEATLTNEYYRRGVERRGGVVALDECGMPRTGGGLGMNLARSIGDLDEAGISARASITSFPLHDEPTWLIIGTDGLFDTLSSDDIGYLVQRLQPIGAEELVTSLVEASFASGSEDNISALAVSFSPEA